MEHFKFSHSTSLPVDPKPTVGASSLDTRCASYCSAHTHNRSAIHLVFQPEPSGMAQCFCGMPLTASEARANSTASSLTCADEPWRCGTLGMRKFCNDADSMINENGICTDRPRHPEFETCKTASSRHCGTTGVERTEALSACPLTLQCPTTTGNDAPPAAAVQAPPYVVRTTGTCPTPVATAAQCAVAAGKPSVDVVDSAQLPRGCYRMTDGTARFNAHPAAVGACDMGGLTCLCRNEGAATV